MALLWVLVVVLIVLALVGGLAVNNWLLLGRPRGRRPPRS